MVGVTEECASESEYVLKCIRERTSPEPDSIQNNQSNLWTGRSRMRADGSKSGSPLSRDDVDEVVSQLIDEREVVSWHGLLAPATEEHLIAIIENERASDTPRKILIGKVNHWLRSLNTDADRSGGESDE